MAHVKRRTNQDVRQPNSNQLMASNENIEMAFMV